MNVSELSSRVADHSVTALDFLAIIDSSKESLNRGENSLIATGLLIKCADIASEVEWKSFLSALSDRFPPNGYIQRIATLGRLFVNYSEPHRARQQSDCTLWLIRNYPEDPCHQQPQVYDLADEFYATGREEWKLAVGKHKSNPNVIRNAALFLFRRDEERCFDLYSLGARLEPKNAWWRQRLQKLRDFHST